MLAAEVRSGCISHPDHHGHRAKRLTPVAARPGVAQLLQQVWSLRVLTQDGLIPGGCMGRTRLVSQRHHSSSF